MAIDELIEQVRNYLNAYELDLQYTYSDEELAEIMEECLEQLYRIKDLER